EVNSEVRIFRTHQIAVQNFCKAIVVGKSRDESKVMVELPFHATAYIKGEPDIFRLRTQVLIGTIVLSILTIDLQTSGKAKLSVIAAEVALRTFKLQPYRNFHVL